ncbi:hypothetical protein HPB52_005048 [Rhipicephalus sanguineus]|uniref:Uncharacterized protein n=1 Tax=Rhipicephalus sanguineus TaxID=34632 RepID=A0A9D4T1F4_RHISA|nr:hypothetical protein HPB52_005048 [Rhipicephalus sanguineus]
MLTHTSYLNYDKRHANTSHDVIDRKLKTCVVVPPTLYEHPEQPSYVPYNNSLTEALDFAVPARNYIGYCNLSVIWAVSTTLKARWFKANGSKVGLLQSCDNVTNAVDVDPYSVCSEGVSGQYQYDQKYMSGVFTNSTHALTFETEQSIKAKVQEL